jgi:hypothetical protein
MIKNQASSVKKEMLSAAEYVGGQDRAGRSILLVPMLQRGDEEDRGFYLDVSL